ncbi:BMP family ABC transporter substrate-binding protein [Castellaniella sp. S9]|uniref:BMP family ABC transporter substrate-binding protein n=1 Tax=Castellaniella sp. S9 TaxID=2993652 RepID=UPI0022B420D8|nr:BMP family ABC transporter substrate-binding protein [Castellaniella sp. S9]
MTTSRRTVLLSLAAMAAAPRVYAQSSKPLDVVFLYDNPIGDVGWVRQHENGRLALEKALGGKIKTRYVQVAAGADSERVMRTLAQGGADLIYGVTFGYMTPMSKVAKQFPKTIFMNCQGFMTGKNMGVYAARTYQGFYMNGYLAAKMSKTGVIGFIASMPVPEVIQDINAMMIAMRSVNPEAVAKVTWLNTWYDPGREREAANALLSDGADILISELSSPVAVQVAQEKGVYAATFQSDMSKYGKSQLSCALLDWSHFYIRNTQAVLDKTWTSHNDWLGVKDDAVRMIALHDDIPADVKEQVLKLEAGFADGTLQPFTGPIVDQDGKERVPAGTTLTDEQKHKIDWLAAGIQGRLPS